MPAPDLLRIADLSTSGPTPFLIEPDAAGRRAIADALGLVELRKLRFQGTIRPDGKRDWLLQAELGATVVQSCVVTLEPVGTRIDQPVQRLYVHDLEMPDEAEVEMPEDDSLEPLGREVDLQAVMTEALSLALPLYPRKDSAGSGDSVHTEPGKTALTDADLRPFAGLAALRDKLAGEDGD